MKKVFLTSALLAMAGVGMLAGSASATMLYPLLLNDAPSLKTSVVVNTPEVQDLEVVGWADVGSPDVLIGISLLDNSGDALEVAWVNDVLKLTGDAAFTVDDLVKTESDDPEWANWFSVGDTGSGAFAFEFVTEQPEYFYLKVGVGKDDPQYSHLLFENVDSLNWGVVTLAQTLGTTGFTIKEWGKFSHLGELGGSPVPEPATMLLFGTGLAGLAGIVRRKKK